jgi:hypothetical protein
MQTWTLASSFASYGATCARHHFSRSEVSDDGTVVVLAIWKDEIEWTKIRKRIDTNARLRQ